MADRAADQHTPRLTIGEVLAVLRDDFPDVTISKIRYLETEQLVAPQRTPSGYRKFSRADVARLLERVERATPPGDAQLRRGAPAAPAAAEAEGAH